MSMPGEENQTGGNCTRGLARYHGLLGIGGSPPCVWARESDDGGLAGEDIGHSSS